MVRTLHSRCRGNAFDPWLGSQDPASHMTGQNNNKDPGMLFVSFHSGNISTVSGEHAAIEYSPLHLDTIDVNNLEYSM